LESVKLPNFNGAFLVQDTTEIKFSSRSDLISFFPLVVAWHSC